MFNNHCHKSSPMKKFILGFIVLTAGALLLAFNLELLPIVWKPIVFSWPMLLIAIGLINLAERDNNTFGVILLIVGGFFLLPKIIVFDFNFAKLFWPVMLILIGLLIMTKRSFHAPKRIHLSNNPGETSTDGLLDETTVFGGTKKILTDVFKGGRVTNIFGGTELDLTRTEIIDGETILEVTSVFGGVEMIVPSDWEVKIKVTSIMGGFADKRYTLPSNPDNKKVLIIHGVVIFGGGEIKSYK